jgi:hypothetical protein
MERSIPVTAGYISVTRLMMLITNAGLLDLFDFVPGFPDVDPREVYDTSIAGDGGIRYVSLDWLIRMKQAAARPKDREDLQKLQPPPAAPT